MAVRFCPGTHFALLSVNTGEVQGMAIRTVPKTVTPQGVCGFESHPLRHRSTKRAKVDTILFVAKESYDHHYLRQHALS